MKLSNRETYFCPVCLAEVSVINQGPGDADLKCCNVQMEKVDRGYRFYYCPTCKAELMWIRQSGMEPVLRCCNEPMVPVD